MLSHELLGQELPDNETPDARIARLEAEAHAAWNSFYVAAAVVAILCALFALHAVLDGTPPEGRCPAADPYELHRCA